MVPFSRQEWHSLTDAAFVLALDDGQVLVYPHALVGAGYLLQSWQLAGYRAWLQERRAAARGGRRLAVLAVLGAVPLATSFLLERVAPGLIMTGFLLSFLAAGWAVLAVLQGQFRQTFPEARRAPGPRPWGRIFRGFLVSRACHLWRCTLVFVVGLAMVVYPALARLPYWGTFAGEAPDHLVFQAITLLVWLAITGTAGWFIVQHIRFRRRHHRAPRPDDLGTLL